ncbi:MAG: hypothetical protein EAZ30_08230 [Betaproteobacteria bacterium]|nr:MAG: hypothetical protein EAZ30_08230 [Betaproteobacteria bacterium]
MRGIAGLWRAFSMQRRPAGRKFTTGPKSKDAMLDGHLISVSLAIQRRRTLATCACVGNPIANSLGEELIRTLKKNPAHR